jgi:hypothetical protein
MALQVGMLAIHYNARTGKKHQAIILHVNHETRVVQAAFFNSSIAWCRDLPTMSAPPSVMAAVGFNATRPTYMVGQRDAYHTFQAVPKAGMVCAADIELLGSSLF